MSVAGGGARILVVEGGWQRGALAATRALGAAGHHVSIASAERGHAARSRWARRWLRIPDVSSHALPDALGEVVRRGAFDVVFAGDDEHLLLLSEHRDRLSPARFPYVDHEDVLRALDKVSLYDAAARAGLAVPETQVVRPPAGERGWIAKERLYRPGASHVHHDPATIVAGSERDLVFQRVVPGGLLAVVVLLDASGIVRYAAAQQAEAVHPEPFGVSVRSRLVLPGPALLGAIRRLFAELRWIGVAELQFIAAEGREPQLIDLNGRFFGSLALSAGAGVDLPSAWVDVAFGRAPDLATARTGARYQWLEGDLRRAAASRQRLREIARSLWWAPGAVHSVWAANDPAPALRHAGALLSRAMRRAARR